MQDHYFSKGKVAYRRPKHSHFYKNHFAIKYNIGNYYAK